MSDRADVVRKTLRCFATAEIRLLVEEAERVEGRELVEDLHVLDRLKLRSWRLPSAGAWDSSTSTRTSFGRRSGARRPPPRSWRLLPLAQLPGERQTVCFRRSGSIRFPPR